MSPPCASHKVVTPLSSPLSKHGFMQKSSGTCIPVEHAVVPVLGVVSEGSFYKTLEEAQAAIYTQEEQIGQIWVKNQSKTKGGQLKKMTTNIPSPTPNMMLALQSPICNRLLVK